MGTSLSKTTKQLREAQFKTIGNRFEDPQAGVFFAGLDLRQIASVDSEQLGHLYQGPAAIAPQGAYAVYEADVQTQKPPALS